MDHYVEGLQGIANTARPLVRDAERQSEYHLPGGRVILPAATVQALAGALRAWEAGERLPAPTTQTFTSGGAIPACGQAHPRVQGVTCQSDPGHLSEHSAWKMDGPGLAAHWVWDDEPASPPKQPWDLPPCTCPGCHRYTPVDGAQCHPCATNNHAHARPDAAEPPPLPSGAEPSTARVTTVTWRANQTGRVTVEAPLGRVTAAPEPTMLDATCRCGHPMLNHGGRCEQCACPVYRHSDALTERTFIHARLRSGPFVVGE